MRLRPLIGPGALLIGAALGALSAGALVGAQRETPRVRACVTNPAALVTPAPTLKPELGAPSGGLAGPPTPAPAAPSEGGQIRVVRAMEGCRSNESLLEWNIEGPPGPKGDRGEPGPAGGGGGQLAVEIVTAAGVEDTSVSKLGSVSCPEGKRALGGGAQPRYSSDGFYTSGFAIVASNPAGFHLPTGWSVVMTAADSAPTRSWWLETYVICTAV